MSLVGFKAQNHPQQVGVRSALDQIDDRETPPELFDPLNERFGFSLDVAAAAHNAKHARYFDIAVNGLHQSWHGYRVWCNPPYSQMAGWVQKAWREFQGGCMLIVMLAPANRTEQGWWQDHIEPFRDRGAGLSVEFLRGRRRFIQHGRTEIKPNERPPFGVCLLIWERPVCTCLWYEAQNPSCAIHKRSDEA